MEEKSSIYLIAIVAIVAIVGMVFMFTGNTTNYVPQGANYVYDDIQGDLAGQSVRAISIKPTTCVTSGILDITSEQAYVLAQTSPDFKESGTKATWTCNWTLRTTTTGSTYLSIHCKSNEPNTVGILLW